MEIKQLYPFVLILIMTGMIIGVGLLVLGNFSDAVRDTNNIVNETSDAVGTIFAGTPPNGTITLTNIPVRDITRITNSSNYNAVLNVDYNVSDLKTGTIRLWNYTGGMFSSAGAGAYVNITYRYYADSKATDALQATEDATVTIPNTWLPLIITVMILAIILTLVIRSFGGKRR